MSSASPPLTNKMRASIGLLEVFIVAIVLALAITIVNVSPGVQLLAIASVTPIIVLSLIFLYYCRKRRIWSFAGASILGAIGVALRVVVSTQPNLEVGGGLPLEVTVFYIILGALVALANYVSFLELRKS